MARGVNKVIIVGNLGNDPETRYFPDGNAVTNATVATSEHWKDKNTGENQERTEWHKITFRGRLAEIAGEYLRKGSKVYIEGKLQTRKWQDQSGNDRYTTEIVVNDLQMLDSRVSESNHQNSTNQKQSTPNQGMSNNQYRKAQEEGGQSKGFDDDIPF